MARAGRSPRVKLLSSLRGEIVDARLAYPEVLHVEVGKAIVEAEIDAESGGLRCKLGRLGARGNACRRAGRRRSA